MTNRSVRDILADIDLSIDIVDTEARKRHQHTLVAEALAAAPVDPWHRKGAGWTAETLPEHGRYIVAINDNGTSSRFPWHSVFSGEPNKYMHMDAWAYDPVHANDRAYGIAAPADTVDAGGKDGAA